MTLKIGGITLSKEVHLTIEENDLYFILEVLKSVAGHNAYRGIKEYVLALVEYLQDMYVASGETS